MSLIYGGAVCYEHYSSQPDLRCSIDPIPDPLSLSLCAFVVPFFTFSLIRLIEQSLVFASQLFLYRFFTLYFPCTTPPFFLWIDTSYFAHNLLSLLVLSHNFFIRLDRTYIKYQRLVTTTLSTLPTPLLT